MTVHSSYAVRRYRRPRLLDPRLMLLERSEGEDIRPGDDRGADTLERELGGDAILGAADRLRVGATERVEGRLGAVIFGADDRLAERRRI